MPEWEPRAGSPVWIALDLEIGWFALTPTERQALPQAAEMFETDEMLEAKSHQREQMLQPLSRLQGTGKSGRYRYYACSIKDRKGSAGATASPFRCLSSTT